MMRSSRFILILALVTSMLTSAGAIPTSGILAAENITADSLDEVTLNWGQKINAKLRLTNSGTTAASFTITEQSQQNNSPAPTVPKILLVNDAGNPNTLPASAFATALVNLGYAFDQVTSDRVAGIPAVLNDYDLVIYAGVPSIVYGLPGDEILHLQDYLDAGGRLILADNDFGHDDGTTAFYTDYFQAVFRNDYGSKGTLSGVDIMEGINPSILSDPFPDEFFLNSDAAVGIFQTPSGNWAGLRIARNSYRAIYLAWDFHFTGTSLVGEPVETEVLGAAMGWILSDMGPESVPWLREMPTTGSLAAGSFQEIIVAYDASERVIPQPGTYSAALSIRERPESPPIQVPVVMHVQPSGNHGLIRGSVIGTGYCDNETLPLDGASIHITNSAGFTATLKTDAGGAYQYWVAASGSPYTIAVSSAGHISQSASAVVAGGKTFTHDIALRWEAPCISLSQPALKVAAAMAATTTVPLTITNLGAGASTFEISEMQAASPSGTPVDIPWLHASPSSGTLASEGGRQLVEVAFDTGHLEQPGVYQAGLRVTTQDPVHPTINVPVTLDLQAPDTWGQVTGLVTELGECDAHSQPLSGAQIMIESASGITHTVQTDPKGHYQFWVETGTYTAVVSAAGHLDQLIEAFSIDPGQVTRREVALRVAAPCVAMTAPNLTVDLVLGQRTTLPITLTNQGALPGAFEFFTTESENSPAGWLSVAPASGTLPPDGGTILAKVTFDAGQAALPGIYQGVLQLVNNNPVSSLIDYPAQMVVAAPAYGVQVSAPTSTLSALPGASIRYQVEIENLGNLTDTFQMDVEGNHWHTTAPDPVTLGAGAKQFVEITVEVPNSALPGASDAATIQAVSQADPRQSASIILITTIPRRYGVSFEPTTGALIGSPGMQVEYSLRLKNTGSAADTYLLTVAGNRWAVALPGPSLELEAGRTVEVRFLVSIPPAAQLGTQDVATVTAASTGEGQAQATAVLTTTVGPPAQTTIFLPLARK